MNNLSFKTLERISKAKARLLWGKNKTISICPVKLMPDGPWRPNVDYLEEEQKGRGFDAVVNSFIYYNCCWNETGYYPAFYLREKA